MRATGETASGRRKSTAWGGPFVFGLVAAIVGILAMVSSGFTGVVTMFVLGGSLVLAGLLEIGSAFALRKSGRFLLYFLGGLLSVVVGVLLFVRPLAGLAAVTLLLAGYFFAAGLFRGLTSVIDRYPGWGWDAFYGVIALVLGVTLFAQWPLSAVWAVGLLVGAEITARGVALMALSLEARKLLRTGAPART